MSTLCGGLKFPFVYLPVPQSVSSLLPRPGHTRDFGAVPVHRRLLFKLPTLGFMLSVYPAMGAQRDGGYHLGSSIGPSKIRETPAYREAIKALRAAPVLPSIIVFDLDYTLWPFWCEMYTAADEPILYPQTRAILQACRDSKVPLGVASRTPTPHVARAFLKKLGLEGMFETIQLIPASSGFDQTSAQKDTSHFPNILEETGVPFFEMLFFDDEHRNIHRVAKLGVTSVLVGTASGLTVASLSKGLAKYAMGGGTVMDYSD
eukprot:jgi/Botrbrau1/11575/Bobra.60_1s0025.1